MFVFISLIIVTEFNKHGAGCARVWGVTNCTQSLLTTPFREQEEKEEEEEQLYK